MWQPDRLYFGPAGIPTTLKKGGVTEGILEVKRLGLDAMEIEFVRSIFLNEKSAVEVKKLRDQVGIVLTVHAPYYINLNSQEEAKVKASVERIIRSAEIGYKAGAWSVCFHAGYYGNSDPEATYRKVKEGVQTVLKHLRENSIEIWIRPEVLGKPSEFGSLEEVIRLSQELEGALPVVDFAHLHARTVGGLKRYQDFASILEKIEKELGRYALDNMHIHVSGIEYGEKGEKRHLNLAEADLEYKLLIKAFREFNIKGVVISESPNLEQDALLLKELFYAPIEKSKRKRSRES
ncbi:MAG: TIM barrel protein [Thermofilum sp.]|nr:TIM barrel protein [Thermofilum sp.]